MTIKTDFHAVDHHGTRDFVLQCHKRPFALTVSPFLPKSPENLIDLELVEFLNIPIKKIEARRFSFAGIETRIVGHISQTVQCVLNGKICGTTHLKAAVVRHFTKLYNIDCLAGGKSFNQLVTMDDLANKSVVYTNTAEGAVPDKSDDQPMSTPARSSAPTTPTSTPRSRPTGSRTSSPSPSPSSPPNTDLCESWCYQGGKQNRYDNRSNRPVDKRWHYDEEEDIWTLPYTKLGPVVKPATPDHTVAYIQLGNEDALTSFCNVVIDGWPMVASPKTTEPTPNIAISVQAISSKQLCGDCGEQFSVCQGNCPRLPLWQRSVQYQHISSVVDPPAPYVVGHTGPSLPPDFSPCSNYCAYEDCGCLRQYEGRDWAS